MAEVSNEVEREQREDENRNDLFVAWSLVPAGLNGAAGGAIAVARDTGGGLGFGRASEERETRGGFELTMRHERHPSERQHQSEHCSNRPHA